MNDTSAYPDKVNSDGTIDQMTRVMYNLAKLASGRMAGLCFGIPVQRVYNTEKGNEKQEQTQVLIEKIYSTNRINSENIKRGKNYFAACEILTLWYAKEAMTPHFRYGVESRLKVRCRAHSPMMGIPFIHNLMLGRLCWSKYWS